MTTTTDTSTGAAVEPTYFLTSTGAGGKTPDGTLPDGAVVCTQAQAENAQEWTISNGAIVAADTTAIKAANAWTDYQATAQAALTDSDKTVMRCYENAVALPAAWATYRKDLRAIVGASSGDATQALPTKPDYPAGT